MNEIQDRQYTNIQCIYLWTFTIRSTLDIESFESEKSTFAYSSKQSNNGRKRTVHNRCRSLSIDRIPEHLFHCLSYPLSSPFSLKVNPVREWLRDSISCILGVSWTTNNPQFLTVYSLPNSSKCLEIQPFICKSIHKNIVDVLSIRVRIHLAIYTCGIFLHC